MSYLLDTHTLIWAITNPQKLSNNAKNILQNSNNEILVSAISFWEISLKSAVQKIQLENITPDDFLQAAIETGFKIISLDATTAASYHLLTANYHRDPFDRMLIWQAIQNKYYFISKDEQVQKYQSEGLKLIW